MSKSKYTTFVSSRCSSTSIFFFFFLIIETLRRDGPRSGRTKVSCERRVRSENGRTARGRRTNRARPVEEPRAWSDAGKATRRDATRRTGRRSHARVAARHASRRKENDGYADPISATVPLQLNHSNLHYNLHLSSCPSSLPFRRVPLPTPRHNPFGLSLHPTTSVRSPSLHSRSLFLVGFSPFGIFSPLPPPSVSISIETTLRFALSPSLASRTCDVCLSLSSGMRACVSIRLSPILSPTFISPSAMRNDARERCAMYATILRSLHFFFASVPSSFI